MKKKIAIAAVILAVAGLVFLLISKVAGNSETESEAWAPLAAEENGICLEASPKLELVMTLWLLAEDRTQVGMINPYDSDYQKAVREYFEPYREDPALDLFVECYEKDSDIAMMPNLFFALSDEDLTLPEQHSDEVTQIVEQCGAELIEEFLSAVRAFAEKTDFLTFFHGQEEYFRGLMAEGLSLIPKYMISDLEDYYGRKQAGYHIVLMPLRVSGGFGIRVPAGEDSYQIYSLVAPESEKQYFTKTGMQELIWHEFSHSYINPLTEKYAAEAAVCERAYEKIAYFMEQNGYMELETAINEHMIRAITARLVLARDGEEAYRKEVNREKRHGFRYMDTLTEKLALYEQNREQWSNMESFYPELLAAYAQAEWEEVAEARAVCSEDSHALTREQMEEDFDYFWNEVEENYPLYGVAERVNGVDYKEIREEYRGKLDTVESDLGFYTLMSGCIGCFRGCGHMQTIDKNFYQYLRQLYGELKDKYAHMEYQYKRLNNTASGVFYEYPADRSGEGEENPEEEKRQEDVLQSAFSTQLYTTTLLDGRAAYVKIPSFNEEYIEKDRSKLEDFYQHIDSCEALIIDIRENGGGSTDYFYDLIVTPNLRETVRFTNYSLVCGELAAEYEGVERELIPIKELDADAFPNLNQDDLAKMDYYMETMSQIRKLHKKPEFSGDIYVLVNNYNYSAAEAFANFCKMTGFATLVGEATGGDGIGIDPMIVVLPNSGICYRHSTSLGLNPDGGSNEEYGTVPDVECESKDALMTCLTLIDEKRQAESAE